jgi:hypothetical protein
MTVFDAMAGRTNSAKSHDWSKLIDISIKIVQLVVTIGIFWVGQQYTTDQKRLERATSLLKSMATVGTEHEMAVKVVEYLRKRKELPEELYMALTVIESETSPSETGASTESVDRVLSAASNDPSVSKEARDLISAVRAPGASRVFIHVRDTASRGTADRVAEILRKNGVKVPPIQTLSFGPKQTELRYFRVEDSSEARRLGTVIEPNMSGVRVVDTSSLLRVIGRRSVPQRQFELWIAPR